MRLGIVRVKCSRSLKQMPFSHTVREAKSALVLYYSVSGSVVSSETSDKIGTIQRRLAWPLRKDDTHKSRNGPNFFSLTGFFRSLSGCSSSSHLFFIIIIFRSPDSFGRFSFSKNYLVDICGSANSIMICSWVMMVLLSKNVIEISDMLSSSREPSDLEGTLSDLHILLLGYQADRYPKLCMKLAQPSFMIWADEKGRLRCVWGLFE
ncbi:unnamed protein product [Musa textilis]